MTLEELVHEIADAVVNGDNGYAEGADESDKRAAWRDELERDLWQVITEHGGA